MEETNIGGGNFQTSVCVKMCKFDSSRRLCSRLAIEKIYFLFGCFLAESKDIIIDERALNISQFWYCRLKGIVTCAPAGYTAIVSFFRVSIFFE